MDRERDRRLNDRWGGETYRPSPRSRRSRSRSRQGLGRPSTRSRSPRQAADSWAPSGSRRSQRMRSRSSTSPRRRSPTPFRGRDRSWTRSPPPQRDERPRSPRGSSWRRSRTPPRQRSPPTSRYQDSSSSRFHSNRSYSYVPRSPRRDQYKMILSEKTGRYSPRRDRNSFAETDSRDSNTAHQRHSDRLGPFSEIGRGAHQDKHNLAPNQQTATATSINGSTSTSRRSSPSSHQINTSRLPSKSPGRSPGDHNRAIRSERELPRAYASTSITRQPAARLSPKRDDKATSPSEPDRTKAENFWPNQSSGSGSHNSSNPSTAPLGKQLFHVQQTPNNPSVSSARDNRSSKESSPIPSPSAAAPGPQRPANISLLSAPTRPKGGHNFQRESNWTSNQSPRWVPAQSTPHAPPLGPRGGPAPHQANDGSRHPIYRPVLNSSHSAARIPRTRDYLANLPTVMAGGKTLPSSLEPAIEKKILQLEADGDKLFEQVLQKQNSKRLSLRDWDRLEKETLASSLRSDVAEEHLHKMVGPISLMTYSSF